MKNINAYLKSKDKTNSILINEEYEKRCNDEEFGCITKREIQAMSTSLCYSSNITNSYKSKM